MPIELWITFVITSSVLLVIPGPTILTVISYSLAHGRRANIPLVSAVALGDTAALVLSLLGLGALLATSAFWFTAVKIVGALYLLYLGFKLLRAGISPARIMDVPPRGTTWRLFANTFMVTALNPKGIVFFIAFLPQFISPAVPAGPQLWILGTTFVVLGAANAALYAVFAASARRLLSTRRAQWGFNFVGGSLLSAAAILALLARRPA